MEDKIIELAYAFDTFYFLMSSVLVFLMVVGFSVYEAGMVQSKSAVQVLVKNIALISIASIVYMVVGYNLMYPSDGNGIVPFIDFFFLGADNDVKEVIASGGDIYYSGYSDFFFQVVFVLVAASIVSRAVTDTIKVSSFLLFSAVMVALIYPVQGYWKWGGGYLDALGFSDFAGAGVVHLCGASAALAGVILIGARTDKEKYDYSRTVPGSNIPLASFGVLILWLGWLGFNGGSELIVSNVAEANAVASIFVNTNAAGAGGVLAALIVSKIEFGKFNLPMVLNGAIGGLVAISAEPLAPSPQLATVVGAVAGVLAVLSIMLLDKLKLDDATGAISAHGVCAIWGLLAVCFTGGSLSAQLLGITVIFSWSFMVSLLTFGVIRAGIGLRVPDKDQESGVDVAECGTEAYPNFKTK